MYNKLFHRDGNAGYVSYSEGTWNMSPVYKVASAADRLIEDGHQVALPEGYDAETLGRIRWATGFYEQQVNVSDRQGNEVAQIARTLEADHGAELTPAERKAVGEVLETVDAARSAGGSDRSFGSGLRVSDPALPSPAGVPGQDRDLTAGRPRTTGQMPKVGERGHG